MSLKIGFIIDPLESLQTAMDTTLLMVAEANKRGHEVYICTLNDMRLEKDKLYINWKQLYYKGIEDDLLTSQGELFEKLASFCDVLVMRKDPPFDQLYLAATYLLDYADTVVINSPSGLRTVNEKIYAVSWPEYAPLSLVSNNAKTIADWIVDNGGQWVVKPLWECGGKGVFSVDMENDNSKQLSNATKNGTEFIMVQRFINEVYEGDKRVFIVDGEAIAWMNRLPPENDFRANIHLGATPEQYEPSDKELAIANAVGNRLNELDIPMACLDMIGGFLTEVNVTSPSGIPEINQVTGGHYETKLVDYIEKRGLISA